MLGLYQTLPVEEPQPRKKEGQKLNQKDISSTKGEKSQETQQEDVLASNNTKSK